MSWRSGSQTISDQQTSKRGEAQPNLASRFANSPTAKKTTQWGLLHYAEYDNDQAQ